MPKDEWGTKRICPTTGRRFYDLKKNPIVSPYTGETVTVDANTRTRVAVAETTKKPEKAVAEEAEVVEDQTPDQNDDDDDILKGTDDGDSNLGDDVLDDDQDENVSLDEITDVAVKDTET
ncbi:MAG: TIGR02300 family protein [Paracoccaceae bacterium]